MFDGDDIARMIFGGLGRGGFGGRGWGRRRGWGRMGGMGGWVIPAMIIGRIIEEATRQHDAGQSPPPSPAPPQPRNSQPATGAPPTPWADTPPVQAAAPEPKPRIECRYCGREVPAGAQACLGCGAPQHP
jgi:hypothetical protein